MPVIIFLSLAVLFQLILTYTRYGKHCYAIGSNEEAARMSGIKVDQPQDPRLCHRRHARRARRLVLCSKNLTAQSGMGVMYELDAIAMAVIGGVSLSGGRGSIIGTVIGSLIFGVIISGFTFLRLDAYYQEMVKGVIIVGAVVLDQWRQRRAGGYEGLTMIDRHHPEDRRPDQALWRRACAGGRQFRTAQGRACRHHGRQRRRQIDLRAPDHRRRAADRGQDLVRRQGSRIHGPIEAREAGIETVFQNLALADDLDVPSNLFLGREKSLFNLGPFTILDRKTMREATRRRR